MAFKVGQRVSWQGIDPATGKSEPVDGSVVEILELEDSHQLIVAATGDERSGFLDGEGLTAS